MIWDETTTPLSPENLNDLEDRISAAATSVANGKETIADAITAKGVTSTANDTFAEMADKISQISGGYASGEITISSGQTKTINFPWEFCLFAAKADGSNQQKLATFRINLWGGATNYNNAYAGSEYFKYDSSTATSVKIKSNSYTGTIYWEAWQR